MTTPPLLIAVFSILAASLAAQGETGPTAKIAWIRDGSANQKVTAKVPGRFVPQPGAFFTERSPYSGTIQAVFIREGDRINAGAPLFGIHSSNCATGVACNVIASRGGVVRKIQRKTTESILQDEAFTEILAPEDVSVRLDVPKRYLPFLAVNHSLPIWVSEHPGRRFQARVTEILPPLGQDEPTRGVRLTPQVNLSHMPIESTLTAEIPIPSGKATVVPPAAIGFFNGQHFIVKKMKDTLKPVAVHILSESSERLWIRPLEDHVLSEGDDILSSQVIFILPKLLSRSKE